MSEEVGRRPKGREEAGGSRRLRALRLVEAAVAVVAFVALLQWVLNFTLLDPEFWGLFFRVHFAFEDGALHFEMEGALVRGVVGTLYYTALVIPSGLAIGFLWGWARLSRHRVLSWPVGVLIELFRGIPPVVLIIFAFLFGLAFIPKQANPFQSALLVAAFALAFHTASYQAEIFRAGFQSVPRGQMEAAQALGMTRVQIMGLIVLPQALRLSLPPLGNEFATVIKDTALLAAIGATELFAIGLEFSQTAPLRGRLTWVFAIWTVVAAVYFLITFAVTRGLLAVEHRLHVPGMEGARA